MQFNSGGIGKDSLTYQNVKNLSLKENSIRNPKKTGKENSESAAISVARVGASVEEKTAARSCPYARKTKTRIENLPPKRNSIRNLDLNRIGKENSESAAISVARIDANAEKKTTARNHLCRKRAGTQVEEDLVFPKKVKTLLFRVEGSNSIIGNQNELKVRQVEAELDKASNLLEEKQSSFDSQAVQPEESKTKIEEAQKEISDERDQLERELEGSSNAAIELNNKVKETLDERDQLERELEGSSNAAIELNNKVKELEEKNDQVNELNEKVFSIETERNTLKDQITKIQNELARKESEIGRLNDQLSKSYQHIEQLKQDKNKKEEELLDQQNKVKELNDKVNSITNERNCLNGQIETQLLEKNIEAYVEEQLARKESEIGRLNDQLSKSYQHIEQLKQDKNKKEEELLDQQNKVKELNDKVNSITNERNCLNGQIETQLLEKNIEAYVEEQLARKESEIGRLNDQLSKSYQHIEQLKQDKNKKEEELLDQQNKVKELNDKVNSITNERNCLNGQIETQLLEKNIEAYVEEQLARKESEIGRLNDQLSKSYQHIEQLKQDKNKKEEELLDQQNKVKELNDKVNSITNERNCLNGQIETQLLEKNIEAYVEEQLARKESEIGRLNDQLSKSYQHIEQLKQDKNKKEEELLDQQNKVKELNDKVNSITNERNCLNGQIETQLLEKNIEAYVEEQLARKESEIGRLNDQLSKSYQHIEQLKQDKNKKEEELLDQQNKVKELNDKVNSITNERNCLNGQIETQLLEKNIEAYVEEQLARKESEIGRLNDQLSKSYQHIEQLKQDKNKKEEELLDQQNKVKELNDKVNSITNERNCLNGQIETQLLEKNIEAYVEEQLARKESEIGRLNDQLSKSYQHIEQLKQDKNKKEEELLDQQNKVKELNDKVNSITNERNCLNGQIETQLLEKNIEAYVEEQLARKESEIGRLNDQLSKSYQHIEQLKQDKNKKEEELLDQQNKVKELNDKVNSITNERNCLNGQIETQLLEKNIEAYVEEQLARKESEIGRLNDQLSKSYQHIEQLKQDKNKKEEELLDQQNKVKELNDKVNSITNERNCLNGQIETQLLEKNIEAYVEEQLARKESEIGRLNDQLSKSYQHIEQLKQDKNKKEEELLDQQNKVKELNDKVNSITNERNCLNGQIETQLLEKNIEAYVEEQLARKESEIGRLNDQLSKSYQHIEQLKQDKNKKEEELLDQQNKVKELNDKVNSITNERNCLNGQIETQLLEKNIEAYVEEQLARKESEIGRLNDQLSKSYQHIEQLKQDKNKKEEELLDQQNKVKELNDKVNSITNERNCLNGQIETQLLEKNIEAYVEEQLARKESEIGRLNDQLSKSYQHIEQLKQDKNKKEEELLDQQNKVKELNDKVNSITNERNCLNGQIETQLLEKNKEFDEFKKERDTLTNQVQEKKNELSAKEEAFSKVQTNAQDLTYEVNQKDQQLEQVVREKQRLEAKFRGLNEKYSEVKNKDRGYIENLTCKLRQAKSEFIDNENKLSDQIEKLKEEKEILLEQLRAKSTGSASFRKQQSKIDSLKQQIKQKEEPKSVRNLEQLQNISGQNKIETTVPENSAESELNSTRLTEFEGNNIHVQASAAPAATVTSMNVKNIEKVPVMLETPSDKSGSQKLVSVQQEMSSVANESSGQVNGSQTNGMQPNNSSNGSIIVTQSVQKNKWPTTATWKLAIAGVLAGIAASVAYFTFSASLLVTGVIAGVGACCLVAAAIVYYCNKPSSSLEKSSIDKVAVNGYTAAASCE